MLQEPLTALAAVLVVGVGAQWLAWRIRVPSILLLLICGVLIGPVIRFFDPTWALDPDRLLGEALIPFVSLSVGLILYEGGLSLDIRDLRGAGGVVWLLVSIGASVTWVGAALGAYLLLDLPLNLAILFGAVMIVSGPTVVLPLIRHIRPIGVAGPILRWESIVIDPIGATAAVLVFEFITAPGLERAAVSAGFAVLKSLVVGGGLGIAGAAALVFMLRRHLVPDHLQNAVSLLVVAAAFATSDQIQPASGLLTVTVMGIALANQRVADIERLVEFKENLRVLLLGTLFILLGARMQLSDVTSVGLGSIGFLAMLILVVRPAGVALCTFRSRLTLRERAFIAWVAPRGVVAAAVSSVFAIELQRRGVPGAERLVPATFVMIVGTVLVYGLTAGPLARRLSLADSNPQGVLFLGAHEWARAIAMALRRLGLPVLLIDSNATNVEVARREGLTAEAQDVLGERLLNQLDLTGIGNLVALTPNDEVNSLAARRLERIFGSAAIFQLSSRKGSTSRARIHGYRLWADDATFAACSAKWSGGAVVFHVSIDAPQKLHQVIDAHKSDMLPLFLVSDAHRVTVFQAGRAAEVKGTGTLVCMASKAVAAMILKSPSRGDALPDNAGE